MSVSVPETDPIRLIGPIFVGIILHWCLLGSVAVQVYIFSLDHRRSRLIKTLVYSIFVLDIIQTVFETDYAWKTLVKHWGDPDILIHEPRSSFSISIMNGLISATVQIFFAWRVWLLNNNNTGKFFAVLITMLAVTQCVSAVFATIKFLIADDWERLRELTPGFTVWLAGSLAADILIASCMVTIFRRARAQISSMRTETLMTKLIVNTIETGAVTAVVTVIELALFLALPSVNYHKTPAFVLGKLYSNVLLANLNARTRNRHLVRPAPEAESDFRHDVHLEFTKEEGIVQTMNDDDDDTQVAPHDSAVFRGVVNERKSAGDSLV